MIHLRLLHHLARADFRERSRRFSFLLTLAGGVYLACEAIRGGLVLHYGPYRGHYNSAWVATLMAYWASIFLSLIGFYIVKNAVEHDRRTRVGEILATTPIGRLPYLLGKLLSNFSVLLCMLAVLALGSVVMQWLRGEDMRVDPGAILTPFLLISVPCLAFVAAVALLFDSLPLLAGGIGNTAYFFVWLWLAERMDRVSSLRWDLFGKNIVASSLAASVQEQFGEGGYRLETGIKSLAAAAGLQTSQEHTSFTWNGLHCTPAMVLDRLVWIALAVGIVLLAACWFDRFDPAREWRLGGRAEAQPVRRSKLDVVLTWNPAFRLPSLPASLPIGGFGAVVLSELRLMVKGLPWWWYLLAGWFLVDGLSSPLGEVRRVTLPFTWLCPLLVWSAMGAREERHGTREIVFSSPRTLVLQLPAVWLAGVIVAVATGSGVALRLFAAHEWYGIIAWGVGALFIPSLALACGVWSGGTRCFEALYLVLWYIGPRTNLPPLDFMGASSLPSVRYAILYLILAAALCAAAFAGRARQFRR